MVKVVLGPDEPGIGVDEFGWSCWWGVADLFDRYGHDYEEPRQVARVVSASPMWCGGALVALQCFQCLGSARPYRRSRIHPQRSLQQELEFIP